MKVTYVYEVTYKKSKSIPSTCTKCGSKTFAIMKQIEPGFSDSDTSLMYHCECPKCGSESQCRKSRRKAIKSWKDENLSKWIDFINGI